jgi:hypothetical protein
VTIAISPQMVVRLDADVASTATTFADATGLSFAVDAGADYLIEAFLVYTSAATTTGINLGVNGPASPAGVVGEWQAYTSATAVLSRRFQAYNQGTATTGVQTANAADYAQLTAMFRNGATAGTFILRFASEVSGSAITLKAGSFLRWQQTAPGPTVNTIERYFGVNQLCQNLATMQNNMRTNVVVLQTSAETPGQPLYQDWPAVQQAVRDLGTAFLQRLALNDAIVQAHQTEVRDGGAALGIVGTDMADRYALLLTWATTLSTATITNQTQLDNGVAAVLANVPQSMLPF